MSNSKSVIYRPKSQSFLSRGKDMAMQAKSAI